MSETSKSTSRILKLIAGTAMEPEEELQILQSMKREELPSICELLVAQKRKLQADLQKERKGRAQAEAALEELRSPPLHPATVLRILGDGRVDLVVADRRQIVGTTAEVRAADLKTGDEVLVNRELTTIVAHCTDAQKTGLVGTVVDAREGRVTIRGSADEEIVAMCSPDLASSLRAGDRILFTQGFPCVIEQIPERKESPYQLKRPPAVSFDDIGGLDEVTTEIRRDLDLHVLHRDRVLEYKLQMPRGMTLIGPPGVGKSMIAQAVTNYLAQSGIEARLLHIQPGGLRKMWYGQSEATIRELFEFVKAEPSLVVIFFDELDTFGARGVGIGQDIDGRVQAALLSSLDGLDSATNVLCIGATNRQDLCDTALIRQGRFGDRIYHIPRPGREATRQILGKYLVEDLPYSELAGGEAVPLIEAATSYLHAPDGGAGTIARVTMQDGSEEKVRPREVLSGALLASAVERAKHVAAHRHLEGDGGIRLEDVLGALDEALTTEARKLTALHVARQYLTISRAAEIVRVELPPERRLRRHRTLRAA